TRAADGLRDLLVRQPELVGETVQRFGLLDRVQVFALQVLDQRDRERGLVVELANDDRDLLQAGAPRRVPAALAGDDLIGVAARGIGRAWSYDDRLQDPLLADR